MAQRTNPARLQREIEALGVAAGRIVGCRSGGPLPEVDWVSPPTALEQALAAQALAAHDADGDRRDDAADVTALDAALSQLGQGTPADRLAAVEALLRRLVARLRRRGGA